MPSQYSVSSAPNCLIRTGDRPFDLEALLQDTARTLSNLDLEHHHALKRLQSSKADPTLKGQIADNLRRRHCERREPYAALIAAFRKHVSSASSQASEAMA